MQTIDATVALPHLSKEAQQRHATMVLGGWRFERCFGLYVAVNPQGYTSGATYTLLTTVDRAWFLYGGNGK